MVLWWQNVALATDELPVGSSVRPYWRMQPRTHIAYKVTTSSTTPSGIDNRALHGNPGSMQGSQAH